MSARLHDLVLDSSVAIALVATWHAAHESVHSLLEERLSRCHRLCLAAHSLIEAYSVLTRLPAPYRLSAADALELLRANFADVVLLNLKRRDYWSVLSECSERQISGGRVHDALIARSARGGVAPTLVTLNRKHFTAFESSELGIAGPLEA